MAPAGFEPATPEIEQPQTKAATGIGTRYIVDVKY
jgi:hypothetical protein